MGSIFAMTSKHTRVGHGLAKVLGIKLDYCNETDADKVTRGESVFSVSSADTFVEQEPTVADWIRELSPTGKSVVDYFWSFFPFLHWIKFYNARWFMGDLVAGKINRFFIHVDIMTDLHIQVSQ